MRLPKWLSISSAFILVMLTTACYNDAGKQYGKIPDNMNYGGPVEDSIPSERAYQTQQLYGNVSHNNQRLEYNEFLSNEVMALYGVNTAIVMVTDQNAYVGVLIDNSAVGTKGTPPETNNWGTNHGIYNPYSPYNDSINSDDLHNGVNNYETAMHHDLLSHRFKQRIAEKIRYLQPALMDVYISANRDFVNAMNNMAQESWKGRSLQPFLAEFNKTVANVFGTAQLLPEK